MASIARRHRAIKHSIAHPATLHHILWMPYAQCMHRYLRRHKFPAVSQHIAKQVSLSIERPTTVAEAIEANLQQCMGTALAQFREATTLNNGKQEGTLLC